MPAGDVPRIVDIHAVDEQQIRRAAAAERLGVMEEFFVGVVVALVEKPVPDGQRRVQRQTIPPGIEGGSVAEFAEPVIGGGGRDPARIAGLMKDGRHGAEAGVSVVKESQIGRCAPGDERGIQRPGKRRQGAVERQTPGVAVFRQRRHEAHMTVGRGGPQAVQQDKNQAGHYQSPDPTACAERPYAGLRRGVARQ